ncbi:flagellar biosynthetic protein FliR [Frondihabitans cladoniiphilus]
MDSIEAVMLAGVRIVVFMVIAPPFNFKGIPAQVKALIGLGLALAVSAHVVPGYHSLDTGHFLVALVLELVTGGILGFLVWVIFAAIQSAGSAIDLFGGFQLAQAYDPQQNVNGAQFTRLFQMTSLVLMFTTGGYLLVIGGLLRTFDAIPIGGAISLAHPIEMLTNVTVQMFLATLQIAGPLIVVLFLADVGLGLLTRVAPALNAFQMGFPLKVMISLGLGGMVFIGLPSLVSNLSGQAFQALVGVS